MNKDEIKIKLEQQEKASYVSIIKYKEKEYIKAIKALKIGVEYLYYTIDNNALIKVQDEQLIKYFDEIYGEKSDYIIY